MNEKSKIFQIFKEKKGKLVSIGYMTLTAKELKKLKDVWIKPFVKE